MIFDRTAYQREYMQHKRGATFLYLVGPSHDGPTKIGIALDVPQRFSSLEASSPLRLQILYAWELPTRKEAARIEHYAMTTMQEKHSHYEWFLCTSEEMRNLIIEAGAKDEITVTNLYPRGQIRKPWENGPFHSRPQDEPKTRIRISPTRWRLVKDPSP